MSSDVKPRGKIPEFWPGQRVNLPPPPPLPEALAARLLGPDGTPGAPPTILLLPGFGNDATDYSEVGYPGCDMKATLERRGFDVAVLPVAQRDWVQVFTQGLWD